CDALLATTLPLAVECFTSRTESYPRNIMSVLVSDLLKTKFTERDLTAQRDIVRTGPPQPELPDLFLPATVGSIYFEQHFDRSLYITFPWIAGCATQCKFFCFPCLLFGQEYKDNQSWSRSGVNDL